MSHHDEGCSASRSRCHTLLATGQELVHQLRLRRQLEYHWTTSNSPCELAIVNVIRCYKVPLLPGNSVTTLSVRRCKVAALPTVHGALLMIEASKFQRRFIVQSKLGITDLPFYESIQFFSCVARCFICDFLMFNSSAVYSARNTAISA